MATPIPYICNHPRITIDTEGTPVDIECSANEVHTNVEQDEATVETFCGAYTSYKPPVWDITLNSVQSFGTDGLWTTVSPFVGETIGFELLPDRTAEVSVDNPLMSGMATVKAFPFIDAAVGEASETDLVLAVQGAPDFSITPGVMAASASASESSEEGA